MSNETSSRSFGRYLQTVRIEKGINLEQVSRETRISLDVLDAIEREDENRLPSDVYVIGFLKAYAQTVGADEQEAIRRYRATRDAFKETRRTQQRRELLKRRYWPRVLSAVVTLILLMAFSIYMMSKDDGPIEHTASSPPGRNERLAAEGTSRLSTQERPGAQLKVGDGADPANVQTAQTDSRLETKENITASHASDLGMGGDNLSRTEVPTQQPAASEPTGSGENLSIPSNVAETSQAIAMAEKQILVIEVVENTWMKVVIDGITSREFSLKPGDDLNLEASSDFNLLIGNAGGIKLVLNGKSLPIPGRSGQVVTLRIP